MTHYFSDQRFIGQKEFPVITTFSHGNGDSEIINGSIRHRGNYSTRSLKIGFRLGLNRAIQH
jgi:endo-beta-N-acetylglucosaminidase D